MLIKHFLITVQVNVSHVLAKQYIVLRIFYFKKRLFRLLKLQNYCDFLNMKGKIKNDKSVFILCECCDNVIKLQLRISINKIIISSLLHHIKVIFCSQMLQKQAHRLNLNRHVSYV